MPLPSPNLDDRDFRQLVEEAERRIKQTSPDWTDRTPSDPGMVLLEVFAHLTEIMLYRLNRVPEKAYIEFLRMIGVQLQPPAAAGVKVLFSRKKGLQTRVEIPRGTRVTVERAPGGVEPPVFATARSLTFEAGQAEAEIQAYHCDLIEGELVGQGTGLPGLSLAVGRPPVVAPTGDELDLNVGVEVAPGELDERVPAVQYEGKAYRIWSEVEDFSDPGDDAFVYVADRMTGTITFAPAVRVMRDAGLSETPEALAEIPPAGRQIRVWYRRGGGLEGNVAANTLTTLKDPIGGLEVTNPSPATGGRAAETVENAMIRGPLELHSLRRTVTARDFELVASSLGAVGRAKAFTKAEVWRHAQPGTVEVLLVPYIREEDRGGGQVTVEELMARQDPDAIARIQQVLDERRPLGTTCQVNWGRYKKVKVKAHVVVHRQEDKAALGARVLERLYKTVNPLPTDLNPQGWGFGQALRASNVYDIVLSEPGVSYVDGVRLIVDEVPEGEVSTIAADAYQPLTWYAGTDETIFRSLNDGDGWELVARIPTQKVHRIKGHPREPGLLAAATRPTGGEKSSRIYISRDAGETWGEDPLAQLAFEVEDLAWMMRLGEPVLFMGTDKGLYEMGLGPGATPVQVLVDPDNQDLGFYAVEITTDVRGAVNVAVAAQQERGVYLSTQAGKGDSFVHIGLRGEDVRVLAVQIDGPRSYLWAGITVPGNLSGKGCRRWELLGARDVAREWDEFAEAWKGGSCRDIAFFGTSVVAATHRGGVAWLDTTKREPAWETPELDAGLPTRREGALFQPIDAVAVDAENRIVITGNGKPLEGEESPELGVHRTADPGGKYSSLSNKEFTERVTLPDTWLFVSGEHEIEVETEDEARENRASTP